MEQTVVHHDSETLRGVEPARVLVVDDDPTIRELLASCLALAGFEVIEAGGVVEAVRLVERSLLPVELVLVDLHVTDGHAAHLVAWLTLPRPRLPVILMSGAPAAHADDSALAARYPLLVKPFSLGALVAAVRAALE